MFEVQIFIGVFITLFGLLLGSFANVIILRLPHGKSIVLPRSHCPNCKKYIYWYDNIPVFSWLFLRGKCRFCKAKISIQYAIVELLMGLLFLALFLKLGLTWTLLEMLIFTFAGVVCSFIDLEHYILPDVFTLSGILIGLVGAFLNPEREFLSAFFGVLMGGGFLWLVAYGYYLLRGEEGMGGGDIKLLAWIGAVFGWQSIPFVILVSSILGSIVGITLMFKDSKGLKTVIPFGPYLIISAILTVFISPDLGLEYFRFFMPSI